MTVRLLTTEEVAQRFRTSPSTVRYWRHLGTGPAGIRVGRRVLYERPNVTGGGKRRSRARRRARPRDTHGGCQRSRASYSNARPSEA
jgi:hypothetical protein